MGKIDISSEAFLQHAKFIAQEAIKEVLTVLKIKSITISQYAKLTKTNRPAVYKLIKEGKLKQDEQKRIIIESLPNLGKSRKRS